MRKDELDLGDYVWIDDSPYLEHSERYGRVDKIWIAFDERIVKVEINILESGLTIECSPNIINKLTRIEKEILRTRKNGLEVNE